MTVLATSSDAISANTGDTVRAAAEARSRVDQAVDGSQALRETTETAAGVTREVGTHCTTVASAIEETSLALATVDEATRRIDEMVLSQRDATAQSETTLGASIDRLTRIVGDRAEDAAPA